MFTSLSLIFHESKGYPVMNLQERALESKARQEIQSFNGNAYTCHF